MSDWTILADSCLTCPHCNEWDEANEEETADVTGAENVVTCEHCGQDYVCVAESIGVIYSSKPLRGALCGASARSDVRPTEEDEGGAVEGKL